MARKIDSIVIVIGLPITDESKIDQMSGYFLNLVKPLDPELTKEKIEVPTQDGKTIGALFIVCKDSDSARRLAFIGDYMQFDKKNRLRMFINNDYKKYIDSTNAPEQIAVAKPPSTPVEFSWYYTQPDMFDQIVYSAAGFPHVCWFNHNTAKLQQIELPQYIQKSNDVFFTNDGSFFVTYSGNKLNFYAGEQWTHFTTLEFPDLRDYLNSPCGRFMLCKSLIPVETDNKNSPNGACIYDILTGKKLVRIPLNRADFNQIMFGAGSHLIAMIEKKVMLYKAREFKEVIELCSDADSFSASPATKLVFTFRGQREAAPPRNAFYNTENGQPVHVVAAFNATSATATWHPKLALCCVIQNRIVKSCDQSSIIIYDLTNEASIGSFTEEIKGTVNSCAWDPSNKHIACIIATSSGRQLIIYDVDKQLTKVFQHPCGGVSNITFSPAGRFFICDDIKAQQPIVQFWDTEAGVIASKNNLEGVGRIEWDSSGAFVIISATPSPGGPSWFAIYLLDGNQVCKERVTNVGRVLWRPRAGEALLTKEDLDAIDKEAEEIVEKSTKFGTIDLKAKEDDAKAAKIQNLQNWRRLAPKRTFGASSNKNDYTTIEFTDYKEF
ncbi:hypothetical protein TVAG_333940 [Trichomonas vaginalis G3]|uniref:Translation initiation factor beta propellor-like domain-containing protein n=1 Tax=Trichomonas vaginalis (strain ATCC PRA-98 / G3) TaxID=412133 RepID=A2EIA0_TRIV3|nr:Eukaryotictranslationinitiationfactor3subunitB family [Trichomonas vaginalis G3]EAY07582.1 hypothetical protein TVAG_333940 [Trichomonas vaginalis G3]KAI5541946.1 Eukaryotictranslationinitiationfactor3subunitB family [Trichomonas vaginalis G3]|eukprot:XP_001319805.1 hypothetical protein [Trichomonas vaginalis G3]